LGKNRDRLSIVAAILDSVNSGASKTKIMYSANLSFKLLSKYLDVSIRAGFVQVDGYKYFLTEHGADFLKKYNHIHERYYVAQKMLDSLTSERDQLSQTFNESTLYEQLKPALTNSEYHFKIKN
jgi:predicted transcriptional regulator